MIRTVAPVVPAWIAKAIITAAISVLVTGAGAWGVHLSAKSNDHEKRIAVAEEHQRNIDKALDEIRDGQNTMNQKLDRLLEEQRDRTRYTGRLYGR